MGKPMRMNQGQRLSTRSSRVVSAAKTASGGVDLHGHAFGQGEGVRAHVGAEGPRLP
ncbi:MAG TPA: hypothetical protein VH062_36570 [Polyangiaceae bacterium]|nr:hypothetical protein [Polyangiaceae bacterium]